jgi:hypothetical protein
MLLDPTSGILIFRYYTIDPAKEQIYKKKLNEIFEKMNKESASLHAQSFHAMSTHQISPNKSL